MISVAIVGLAGVAAGAGVTGVLYFSHLEKIKLKLSESSKSLARELDDAKKAASTLNRKLGEVMEENRHVLNEKFGEAMDEKSKLMADIFSKDNEISSLRIDCEKLNERIMQLTKDLESSQHALAINSESKECIDSKIDALKAELLSSGTAREKIRIKKAFSRIFCEDAAIDISALIGGQSTNDCAKSIQKTRENTNKPRLNGELSQDVLSAQEMVAGMIAAIGGDELKEGVRDPVDTRFKKKKLGACNWILQRHEDWTPGKQ